MIRYLLKVQKAAFIIFILLVTLGCNKTYPVRVTTSGMREITATSIIVSGKAAGYITGDSNNETGVCISTSINATINDRVVFPQISYTSQFDVEILNLIPNTTYYAKAFFKNLDDVYYGYELKFTTPKPGIGEFKEGGIVFWINPADSLHGLVCTTTSIGIGNVWGSSSDLCLNLSLNGYDDWYLPSKDELYIIFSYNHIVTIASAASPSGGSGLEGAYWSSTEYDSENAWFQSFYDGGPTVSPKNNSKRTRAIRAF